MGWFSKKEKVPEIPPAPKLPEMPRLPGAPERVQGLPSVPNEFDKNFNQEMVKSAAGDSEKGVSEKPLSDFHFREESRGLPELPEPLEKRTFEMQPSEEPRTKSPEPIFVRIDKFQAAQRDFSDIKKKVKEVEFVLRKINEVKLREESEISSWTQNLEKIKAKLVKIDSDIFSKI